MFHNKQIYRHMSETDSQTKILTDGLASISKAQAREINEFLDNREAKAISVGDLLKQDYKYFIPNYQRGYRWTSLEVETLLRDIEAASKAKKHCLQPLVLQKREGDKANEYAVIDGQQRLTTISIILAWCNQKEKATCERPSIEYETRTGSLSFLENIMDKTEGDAEANVDFWNMYQAYVCCEEYAKGKENIVSIIKENLLNHCSFILYIAGEGENEHEIFKRLNSGKIALTNAELTKALLLHDRPYEEQLEMALKWDEMMHFFENDDFWYFICPEPESEKYQQTRLDFLIELVAGTESGTGGDRYASFRALDTTIREGKSTITAKWKELTKFYHIMRYWYEDVPYQGKKGRSFYHLVGFIIHAKIQEVKKEVKILLTEFENNTKNLFRENCLTWIKNTLSIASKDDLKNKVSELVYGKDNGYISSLLLLMNIATLEFNAGENSRYPFASHIREEWSLEHIRAKNEACNADRLNKYKALLLKKDKIITETEKEEDAWNNCIHALEDLYEGGDFNYETSFGNLALLPKNFNSLINNKEHQEKRELIAKACVQTDKNAILPICTRYAFFKYYSPNDDSNIVWDGKNAYDYTEKAIDLIYEYLNPETQA